MQEYYLPFLYITLFIGYEISFYLIYQYIKLRKKKITLNRIILAYGLLSAFGMSGVFIRTIASYYFEDILLHFLLYKFSHILIAFGVLIFLITLSGKSFDEIVNVKLTKTVLIIASIISTIIIFVIPKDLERNLIYLSLIIGSIYLTYSHIKIIRKIPNNAKKRFILIYIGFSILLSAILFRAEESSEYFIENLQQLIELVTIPLMILGLLIILFGVYKFPVLLELNWQNKIEEIFIIDSNINEMIFFYNFSEKNDSKNINLGYSSQTLDKLIILTTGISEIEDFISNFINKDEDIEKISHGDQYIFINHGDHSLHQLLFFIIASEDLNSIGYFLDLIKKQVQKSYKNILINNNLTLKDKKSILLGFNKIIDKFLKRGDKK
ncbi:MAG: hypothetical protein KGD63_04655 [Candidatus Lokiarchaeota archaeon]|nr:hypothetical protein [Candidatus Lokiarchaeota archaeon]